MFFFYSPLSSQELLAVRPQQNGIKFIKLVGKFDYSFVFFYK